MRLREATPDDADAVAAVAADAWWAACSAALSADAVRAALADLYDEAFLSEIAAEAAAQAEFRFLVAVEAAENGERVVGFASAAREWADEAELFTLYVDPDRWGEGVGSELLAALEAWAADRGAGRLVCSALADNPVAVGFLESRGFERTREVEAAVGGETTAEYEFEKPLEG